MTQQHRNNETNNGTHKALGGGPVRGVPGGGPVDGGGAPIKPPPPWWANERRIIQLLAIFGAVITIVGAGYLVSLVTDLDFITPSMRVGATTLLGVILLGGAILIQKRQLLPVVSGGLLIASAGTFGFVLYAILFVYHWWPLPLGLALFILLTAMFFGITRAWNAPTTTIILGYELFAFFFYYCTHYQNETAEFLYVPGASIGLLMLIAGLHKHNWNNPRGNASLIMLFGTAFVEIPYTQDKTFTAVCALATAAATILITHWDRTMRNRTFRGCAGITPALYIAICWVFAYGTTWLLWCSFLICLAWVALTYLGRGRTQIATNYLIAWWLSATTLPLIFASDAPQITINLVTIAGLAFTLYWYAKQRMPFTAWLWWIVIGLLVNTPLHASALIEKSNFYPPIKQATIAVALLAYIAVGIWCQRDLRKLPELIQHGIVLLGLHQLAVSVIVLAKIAAGTHGFEYSHAIITITWLAAGAWLISWKTPIRHPWNVKLATTLILAGALKLFFIDNSLLPMLTRSIEYLTTGLLLLIAATRRGGTTHRNTPKEQPEAETTPQPAAAH